MILKGIRVFDFTQYLAGPGVPAGPVLTPLESLEHEYFLDRGMVRTVSDPILGEIQIPGFPFKFSAQPDLPEFEAPLWGEHNAAVLSTGARLRCRTRHST